MEKKIRAFSVPPGALLKGNPLGIDIQAHRARELEKLERKAERKKNAKAARKAKHKK